jgi:hypothetical protein
MFGTQILSHASPGSPLSIVRLGRHALFNPAFFEQFDGSSLPRFQTPAI